MLVARDDPAGWSCGGCDEGIRNGRVDRGLTAFLLSDKVKGIFDTVN